MRLTTKPDIERQLREYQGKQVNIVLRNRTVLYGEVISIDQEHITFADLRGKKFSLSLDQLSEVYLDFKE